MDPLEERIRAFDAVAGMARDAMALMAVFEVGAFSALRDGPATAAELGAACGVSGHRLGAFLDRVAAHGFLVKSGSRYALVDGDAALFDPDAGRTRSLGFASVESLFTQLSRSVGVLRSDVSLTVAGTGGEAPPEERARFLRYLHDRSQEGAAEVAERLSGEPVRRVVDLGSGIGTYAAALLARNPTATATLVDRVNAREVVEEFLRDSGLEDRAHFVGGDFLTDDFGDGHDLAVVSNIVHNVGEEATRALLARLHERLVPGGRVALKDLCIDDDRLAPDSAGRFAVTMALFTPRGGVFPAREVAGWLTDAGFDLVSSEELEVAAGSWLVVGRRP